MTKIKKEKYGNFGVISNEYQKGRKKFPTDVFEYLINLCKDSNKNVLDLGCGTGISTRQIKEYNFNVIGADIDPKMIGIAEKISNNIDYFTCGAESLVFENESFDVVTAFSSFHWFTNERAMTNIRNVLKKGGMFFVVNKNDKEFKSEYKQMLESYLKKKLPNIKKNYNPGKILRDFGFRNVKIKEINVSEYFNLSDLLKYLQSVSLWNFVDEKDKNFVLSELKNHYKDKLIDGKIERKIKVLIVHGLK